MYKEYTGDLRDKEALTEFRENQVKQLKQERESENSLYAAVFNTEAGRRLIGLWKETYVYTWIAKPADSNIAIGIRQGEANFVMDIVKRLEQMEKGDING